MHMRKNSINKTIKNWGQNDIRKLIDRTGSKSFMNRTGSKSFMNRTGSKYFCPKIMQAIIDVDGERIKY